MKDWGEHIRQNGKALPLVVPPKRAQAAHVPVHPLPEAAPDPRMVWLPGGPFLMGSESHYPEEAPIHAVTIDSFWIDTYAVTNEDFARFVSATGYRTLAERPLDPAEYPQADEDQLVPGSLVFRQPAGPVDLNDFSAWWVYVPGTNWRHPDGPDSDIAHQANYPVVHIAYEDAEAYARFAGKVLPSEAQWEYAARGGLAGATYAWGNEFAPDDILQANTWQGIFPWENLGIDGLEGRTPVGAFPPNGYGLYDMIGNVWEWTSDWYSARHQVMPGKTCCVPLNPQGASREQSLDPEFRLPQKVLKGGSYLCAPNYCQRYRPAARSPQTLDSSTCHTGFRCLVPA